MLHTLSLLSSSLRRRLLCTFSPNSISIPRSRNRFRISSGSWIVVFIHRFSWHLALRIFPLSILYCLMVTMSNLCLKYVEVSFYQISRSLGIPMIPLIKYKRKEPLTSSYLLFGETTTLRTVLSCITVVVGYVQPACLTLSYIAGVDGEVNFSLKGTLFGLGASAVGTFYTIYLKRYLSNVVNNSWLLTFYTNFNSCIILPFLCLVLALHSIYRRLMGKFRLSGAIDPN